MPDPEIPQEVTDTITEGAQAEVVEHPAAAEGATAEEAPKEGETAAEVKTEAPKPEDEAMKQRNRENAERRIEKKRLRELEIENARLQGFNEALKTGGKTDQQTPTEQYSIPRPVQKNDEPFEDFVLRLQDWNLDKRNWQQEQKGTQEKRVQATNQLSERVITQRTAGESKYEDFMDVVSQVNMPTPMFNEVLESDIGHDIAYFLGQNQQELARISALPSNKQIKEIGRLEDKLRAGVITKPKTEAPDPPPTVRAGSVDTADRIYTDPNITAAERIRANLKKKGINV